MKIIPVLDILNNQVVQGIAGEREKYQPITNSVITSSSEPIKVIQSFYEKLGLSQFYIADLDLIQASNSGEKNNLAKKNLKIISTISQNTLYRIMVDGGCKTIDDVKELISLGIDQVVIGTETLKSMEILQEITSEVDKSKLILSIDLMEGKLLAQSEKMKNLTAIEVVEKAKNIGINTILVLELKKVGSQAGPLNETLLEISEIFPEIQLFTGGGVRDVKDLKILKNKGIKGILIATAFHKGNITREDLMKLSR